MAFSGTPANPADTNSAPSMGDGIRRLVGRAVAACAVTSVLVGIAAPAATAAAMVEPAAETRLEERLHAERDAAGLHRYERVAELDRVAREWAVDLASRQTLEHRSNLGEVMGDFETAGEVVGRGSTTDGVHDGWMNSPPHRRELMHASMTQAGYGAAYGNDGLIYLVEVFRKPASPTSSASHTPTQEPASQPTAGTRTEPAITAAAAPTTLPPTATTTTTTPAPAAATTTTTAVKASENLDHRIARSSKVLSASRPISAIVATPAASSPSTPSMWILISAWGWCSVALAWVVTSRRFAGNAGTPR